MPAASVNGLSYAPGKFDGASQLHYVQWHRDCTCWRPLSGWFSSVTLR